jgi:hypothetical protein
VLKRRQEVQTKKSIRLEILSSRSESSALLAALSEMCPDGQFRLAGQTSAFRSLDPSVLVAVVGASGTALGALLGGLLAVAKQKHSNKIVIRGKSASLEVPADTSLQKIDALLERIREMENLQVILSDD